MIEEQTKDLSDYLGAFRRRKGSILVTSTVILAVSVLAALLWPPTYRSTATILIEEQEVPPDLVRSTITSYAAQRIQQINARVMTRANLMQIIEKYDLYKSKRRHETTEEIMERMRGDIKLDTLSADVIDPRSGRPMPATIAFTLAFEGDTPAVTQKVANELTTLYLNENLRNRTEKAAETYTFLSSEADKLRERIVELEAHISDFKKKNEGRLPELATFNRQQGERIEAELRDVEGQLRSLDDRKFYLEGQLASLNPLTPTVGAEGQQILDPVTQLKTLRSQYISASAKYSPDHPDVARLKREIEGLEKQTGSVNSSTEQAKELAALRTELAAAREKYSPDHPDVIRLTKAVAAQEEALKQIRPTPESEVAREKPDNPTYINFKAQLEGFKSQTQALTAQREALKAKLFEYEKRLQQTPEVERNFLALNRDYENTVRRYQEIRQKQNEAQVGQELEKERKGERFSLIDPPQLPEEPVKPNRPAIIILGFLLSVGGGLGFAAAAESMDSSVRGVRGATELFSAPPLSVIPYLRNSEDLARVERKRKIVAMAIAGSFVLIVLLAHFLWTPLDVLWFKGLRKVDNVIGG
ncbi:lipopolysaccharide biosynthesis protein [Sulfuricaulis limicola]|uniref:Lipopolysaccharide biosynthesis protein n=1 Tax=Sulfuricaulis limicola TaxID=1620215 RepID=A0A1B4XGN5_9GAMM|nr:GNVR domain-containing protein [Sulfuricaulis limicola]BAV33927.1 lipopolysaccharide biosynthesis protein [Sulfuricaulis limicola]